jgi:hypothetical protein|tara:strand:+ start:673 stop:909 length:237 start_codon:yes stop_codon:yes gene_type:complete
MFSINKFNIGIILLFVGLIVLHIPDVIHHKLDTSHDDNHGHEYHLMDNKEAFLYITPGAILSALGAYLLVIGGRELNK